MIETRRSAHQNHPKKTVLYTYCPDEPVKPISQTVDKNYEILSNTSWQIMNPKKQIVNNSEFGQGRYDRNRLKCSEFDILHKLRLS